jgi:hypothetical protein
MTSTDTPCRHHAKSNCVNFRIGKKRLTFQDDKPIARLLNGPGGGEHLLRARPHAYVLGEIFPAHSAGPIN